MDWHGGTLHCVLVILGLGITIATIDKTSAEMDSVYTVPEAPVVNIFSKMADRIVFALQAPGEDPGAPVHGFRVEFRPATSSINDSLTLTVPKTSTASSSHDPEYTFMQVHSLQANTQYAFAFYARNSIGESRPTEVMVSTPAATHPGFYAGLSKPKITTAPRDFRARKNERAFFFCKADGEPTPATFSWETADGRSLRRKQMFSVVEFPGGSSLVITNAKTKLDGRAFTCVAKNNAGEARASATLYVYKNEPPPGFPVISEGPSLQAVEKGKAGTLSCKTNMEPTDNSSRIYWLKDSVPVIPGFPKIVQFDSDQEHVKRSDLSINVAEDSDQGKYECVAENDIGSVISPSALLYVKVRRVPPNFVTAPADIVDVEMNGETSIMCSARGSPTPTIRWLRGNFTDVTPADTTYGQHVSILRLKDVMESANYTCVATSELGRVDKEVYVRVLSAPPSAPRDVRARPASATSVVVEWDEPKTTNTMITGYTIFYTRHPDYPIVLWLSQDVNSSNTRMTTIDGLEANKTYTFSVLAYSKEGQGPMSKPVQVVLVFRIIEPLQPRNLVAKPVSPSEIEISWDPPLDIDQITSYTTYISHDYSQQHFQFNIPPALTAYKLKDLDPDTAYKIVMSGNNKFGQSARSVEVQARTPEYIPEEPQRVHVDAVNSTTLHVEWHQSNPHSVIKGYYIYYVKLNKEGEPIYTTEKTFHVAESDANEAVIGGLDPDTTYSVTLAAYTRKGDGMRSKAKTVSTREGGGMLEPGFLPVPTNASAEVGQSVELPCHIKNLGTNTVVWRLDGSGVPITVGESVFLPVDTVSLEVTHQSKHESHWNLIIRDVKKSDAGTYVCQIMGPKPYTRYITLDVLDTQKILKPAQKAIQITGPEFVNEFGTIQVECSATGITEPPYAIDWFFNGIKIRPSQAHWQARTEITEYKQHVTINSTLIITNATTYDGGRYVCRSTDLQVVSKEVIVLHTQTLPKPAQKGLADDDCVQVLAKDWRYQQCFMNYSTLLQQGMARSQDMMDIICSTAGQQKMECVFEYAEQCPEIMSGEGGINLKSFIDMGGIGAACAILTGSGSTANKGLADDDCVHALAKDWRYQQCFMNYSTLLQQGMARSQDMMDIICSTAGQQKMECVFEYAEQCPEIMSGEGGINLTSFIDMGGIGAACAILKGSGSSGNKAIQITGPDFVNEFGTVQLECSATGITEPPYGIDWFLNGRKIRPSQAHWQARTEITEYKQHVTINSTLIITNATKTDEGHFTCRSTDGQVVSKKVVILWDTQTNLKPAQKGSVDGDCVKELNKDLIYQQCIINYSTFLQREMARSQDIMGIICSTEGKRKIACFFKYVEQCPDIMSTGGGMDLTFINQTGGIEAACAIIGGAASGGFTSGNKAPDSMPRNLTIVPLENEPLSVTVSWQPPDIRNGNITGYLVFYTTDPSQDVHSWIVEGVIGETHSLNITYLAENTTYYFKAQARNNNGYGPLSSTEIYSTPLLFSYPRNISVTASGHELIMSWDPPPTDPPPTMFYTVHVTSGLHLEEYRVSSEATNFTLTLLSRNTYQIQISMNDGDRSPAIVVKPRALVYACDDRGVGDYSCSNLEKAFGSTKKMCKKAFHECCDTCSSSRRTCKRERHVVMEGKVHDCNSLVQQFGKATTCTIFTKECCITCREEEEFAIESIETY